MATGLNKKYITQTEHILTIQVSLMRLKLIYICNSIDEAPEGDKKKHDLNNALDQRHELRPVISIL